MWDKSEVHMLGNTLGTWETYWEPIGNLGNIVGTHWELKCNIVGTHWELKGNIVGTHWEPFGPGSYSSQRTPYLFTSLLSYSLDGFAEYFASNFFF